jgi:hypothetical protein
MRECRRASVIFAMCELLHIRFLVRRLAWRQAEAIPAGRNGEPPRRPDHSQTRPLSVAPAGAFCSTKRRRDGFGGIAYPPGACPAHIDLSWPGLSWLVPAISIIEAPPDHVETPCPHYRDRRDRPGDDVRGASISSEHASTACGLQQTRRCLRACRSRFPSRRRRCV